jgi:predicted 2-oxoglutarate/Fe(II)-dependent dioxygenase YbiX
MLLHVPQVLTRDQVASMRSALDAADWVDGRESVGAQGARVKNNRQLPEHSPVGQELARTILAALARNPLFFSAALPLRFVPPLFNRYEGGRDTTACISTAPCGRCPAARSSCAPTCRARSSCASRRNTRAGSSW